MSTDGFSVGLDDRVPTETRGAITLKGVGLIRTRWLVRSHSCRAPSATLNPSIGTVNLGIYGNGDIVCFLFNA